MTRGGALRRLRHRGMSEATTLVRRDVRTPADEQREDERAQHQLFGAPTAAHAVSALEAAAFEVDPPGGMFPPSQLRHDCAGSASGALLARM